MFSRCFLTLKTVRNHWTIAISATMTVRIVIIRFLRGEVRDPEVCGGYCAAYSVVATAEY